VTLSGGKAAIFAGLSLLTGREAHNIASRPESNTDYNCISFIFLEKLHSFHFQFLISILETK